MVSPLLIIGIIASFTCFFGITFSLYLMYLSLKIKMDFPENLRLEIDKHKNIYRFIRIKGIITPQDLVEEFEGIRPGNSEYFPRLKEAAQELEQRSSQRLKTLVNHNSKFSLSFQARKYFVYDNPTLRELLRYIWYMNIKHEPEKLLD